MTLHHKSYFFPTVNPTFPLDIQIYVAELQSCYWPATQVVDPGPPLHSFRASSGLQHIGGPVRICQDCWHQPSKIIICIQLVHHRAIDQDTKNLIRGLLQHVSSLRTRD